MTNHRRKLRLHVVGASFALVTMVLWGRLIQVQIFEGAHYDSLAAGQSTVERKVPPTRGCIFDRNGSPLALSAHSFSVAVHPKQITDKEAVVSTLSKCLSMSKQSVRAKLRSRDPFVYVAKRCDLSKDAQKRLKKLHGVVVETRADRVHPYGATGAKVVGLVGRDGQGMAGSRRPWTGSSGASPAGKRYGATGAATPVTARRSPRKDP